MHYNRDSLYSLQTLFYREGSIRIRMLALYIILGIFGFLALILALPIQICLHYTEEDGFQFRLKYAWIPLVDSRKERPEKPKDEKKDSPETEEKKKKKEKKKGGSGAASLLGFLGLEDIASIANVKKALDEKGLIQMLADLAAAVRAIFARIFQLLGKGVFKHFTLRVVVGDEDAADAAMNYGTICSIIYPTITLLDSAMTFRRRTVDLRCDFSEEKTRISFDGQLNYRPWHFVCLLGGFIMNYLKRSVK